MQHNQQEPAQRTGIDQLCLKCGLCCNGVLFADVQLTESDNTLVLENAGVKLRKSRARFRFNQPCSCFEGESCRIYEVRPSRCRNFDCHTLKQFQFGQIGKLTALKRIRNAKSKAQDVLSILQVLGNQDGHLPLIKRYQKTMREPVDLSQGDALAEQHAELMMAVSRLMDSLHRDFLAQDVKEE